MVRKSARGAKWKWPCGNCGFQCNDDAIFCEDCFDNYYFALKQLKTPELWQNTNVFGLVSFPAKWRIYLRGKIWPMRTLETTVIHT